MGPTQSNNLKLNLAKSQKIIFVDKQRKQLLRPIQTHRNPARRCVKNYWRYCNKWHLMACRFHSIFKRSYCKLCVLWEFCVHMGYMIVPPKYLYTVFQKILPLLVCAVVFLIVNRFLYLAKLYRRITPTIKRVYYFPSQLLLCTLTTACNMSCQFWLIFRMENVKFKEKRRELKIKSKHWQNNSNSYSKCSKCLPLAFIQLLTRLHHWSIASSMTDCCTRCQSGVASSAAVATLKLVSDC